MSGDFRRGLFLRRTVPFLVSGVLLLWAVFGGDIFSPPPQPLRVALHDWIGYSPFFRAAEVGLLDPSRVELNRLSSAPASGIGIDAGTLDAVGLTLDEALRLLEERRDLRIVLAIDESAGADAIVTHEGIPDVPSLRGHRIAVEPDSTSEYLFSRALELNGVDPAAVEMVPVTPDQQGKEWRERRVDAVATFEPVMAAMVDAGGKVIFDSRQIPGEIVDVLVMRADVLDARLDDVRHLLHAWFAVIELDRSPGSTGEAAFARHSGQSPQDTRRSLSGLRFPKVSEVRPMITGASPVLLAKAVRMQEWLHGRQLVAGDISPLALFGPDVDALYAEEP